MSKAPKMSKKREEELKGQILVENFLEEHPGWEAEAERIAQRIAKREAEAQRIAEREARPVEDEVEFTLRPRNCLLPRIYEVPYGIRSNCHI
jgi:hypothetical protein